MQTKPAAAAATAPKADPPPEPSLAIKRAIRAEIEAAYDEANGRYFKAGSDADIAKNLAIPRAWVSAIRELYGPDANEDRGRALKELEALKAETKRLEDEFIAKAAEAEANGRKITKLMERLA